MSLILMLGAIMGTFLHIEHVKCEAAGPSSAALPCARGSLGRVKIHCFEGEALSPFLKEL